MRKLVVNQMEWDFIRSQGLKSRTEEFVDDWMEQTFTKVIPIDVQESMNRINQTLRDGYQERLGELAVEYGYRVAEDPEVPGVRNRGIRGLRPNTVIFDEAHNLSEVFAPGESGLVTQRWLEHRRVCRRTLLDCLSREAH